MKIFVIIFFLLFLSSCSTNLYEYEDLLYASQIKTFAQNGVDYDAEFKKFEKYMIDEGILENELSSAYYEMYVSLADCETNYSIKYNFQDSLLSKFDTSKISSDINVYKMYEADSNLYYTSRLCQIQNQINVTYFIDSDSILQQMVALVKVEDFEHPFYRELALNTCFMLFDDIETGLYSVLPKIDSSKKIYEVNGYNILSIKLNKNDELMIQRKPTSIDSVQAIVTYYLLYDGTDFKMPEREIQEIPLIGTCSISKLIISVQCDRETRYDSYLELQNSIIEAFNSVRNHFAIMYFNLPYAQLNSEQQKAIKQLVPMKISEASLKE